MADEDVPKVDVSEASAIKSEEDPEPEVQRLYRLAEDNIAYIQQQKCTMNVSQKYSPGFLLKHSTSLGNIRQRLLNLILEGEEDDDISIIYRRPEGVTLEESQSISIISHSLAALVATYDEFVVKRVALQVFSETTLWVNRLFRFFDSTAYFHRDAREGLMRVLRMVLHMRYPKYSTNGYEALYTRPPVIYYNSNCWLNLGQSICTELGLPTSSVTSVAGTNLSLCRIDPRTLEKAIVDDIAAARTPLLVIASVGSPLFGHIDDLQQLREVCQNHNVWLHVDGYSLASLGLESSQEMPSEFVDSMSLNIGPWIGMPNLSSVTLYLSQEAHQVHASGMGRTSQTLLENTLPLWVTIQALGYEEISRRIKNCLDMTSYLLSRIEQYPELRIINKEVAASTENNFETTPKSSHDKVDIFEDVTSVVVFQYVQQLFSERDQENDFDARNPLYYDNLNSWLVQILARNIPTLKTDIIEVDNLGVCLRVCFLESAYAMNTSKDDIDYYCSCLKHQLSILNATVKQRMVLYENHNKYQKLQLVQIREWAGLGGVRFIPDVWADRLNELTDTGKEDINILNSELVAKLKTSDSAFSVGEADDGMLCVRFGMVDEELNMDELINHVISVGQEIEDSSKFLETMTEMVKHGIEEANKELVLENQEKLLQEGILKQVPVIGSLVSWWYPAQSESGIKGRSFDLSSGTIESTENIYKYHMQIKEGVPHTPPPATKVLINPSSGKLPSQQSPSQNQNDVHPST